MRIFKDLTIRIRMPQSIATRWQLFIYLIISQALKNVNRDLHFAALCQKIMVLLIEALEISAVKRFSDLSGQIVVEVEIVCYRKAHSERFLCFYEMADESIILKDMKDVYNGWMREEEMAIKILELLIRMAEK